MKARGCLHRAIGVFMLPGGRKAPRISRSVPINMDVTCNSEYPVSKLVLASYLVLESQGELNY